MASLPPDQPISPTPPRSSPVMDLSTPHLDPTHPQAPAHPTMLAFANYRTNPSQPDIVLPSPSVDEPCPVRPFRRLAHHAALFRRDSRLATALRYSRYVACFNLYPASPRDLHINDLLWTVAQTGEYDPVSANLLLENNVLALAMPAQFYTFLASTSREELKLCILEVLALIAEDEDAEGLNLMKFELEASVWDDLVAYVQAHPAARPRLEARSDHGAKLMSDVEMLLRLCHLSPWKIEVHASFVSPRDMNLVLNDLPTRLPARRAATTCVPVEIDRPLVRSAARRPVSSVGARALAASAMQSRLSNKKLALWKQFQSWRVYRRLLVDMCGVQPRRVTQALLASIAKGTQEEVLQRVETVMACACVSGNLLSSLPREVVYRIIAPYVLLTS